MATDAAYEYVMESPLGVWVPRHVLRKKPASAPAPIARADDDNAPVRRTRQWRRLEEVIYDALLPFADARRAVVAALGAVEPVPEHGAT